MGKSADVRILFFVGSLNAGGAERVACTLANAWTQQGQEVTLVPTFLQAADSFYAIDDSVRLIRLGDRVPAWRNRLLPGLAKWRAMRSLVKSVEPDVVLSFLTNVNVNVLLATLGMKRPVIVCERTNPAHSQNTGVLLRLLRRLLYRRAHTVVMQTQASVAPFRDRVPAVRRVAVVPNPLPQALADARTVSGTAAARPHIAAMGRLVSIKQFDLLIAVFARLASRFPQWDLVIWGEGPLRDTLNAQIQALGMQDRIRLAGRTAQPWLALRRAQVFAMTSRVEGFPNVLMEAMALGLPCLAVDCPSGPAEISQQGQDAVLVPLGSSEALEAALAGLLDDERLRAALGEQAAASVRARYALPVVLAQWEDLFLQACRSSSYEA